MTGNVKLLLNKMSLLKNKKMSSQVKKLSQRLLKITMRKMISSASKKRVFLCLKKTYKKHKPSLVTTKNRKLLKRGNHLRRFMMIQRNRLPLEEIKASYQRKHIPLHPINC
jgi:hypothetical protein